MKKRLSQIMTAILAATMVFSMAACATEVPPSEIEQSPSAIDLVPIAADPATTQAAAPQLAANLTEPAADASLAKSASTATASETTKKTASTVIVPVEESNPELAEKIRRRMYENTIQSYIDDCYLILDDIAYLRANGHGSEELDRVEALMLRGIDGRAKSDGAGKKESRVQGTDATELYEYNLSNIFNVKQRYPDLFVGEPLFETLQWSLAWKHYTWYGQPAGVRDDSEVWDLLYPNLGELKVAKDENGTATISYEGYEGKIVVYEGLFIPKEEQLGDWESNPKIRIFEGTAVVDDYNGTVYVSPLSEFGLHWGTDTVRVGPGYPALYCKGPQVYYGTDIPDGLFAETGKVDNIDHVYDALKGATRLYTLWIDGCKIDDLDALMSSIPTKDLDHVVLQGNSMKGTVDLSMLPSEMFGISLVGNNEVTDLKLPANMTNGGHLSLSYTGLSSLDFLDGVDTLDSLAIVETKITSLDKLAGKTIERMNITISEDLDISAISEIKGLKELTVLGDVKYKAAVEAEIAGIEGLELTFFEK